jgi:DNA-binding transcriptional MerR regulator
MDKPRYLIDELCKLTNFSRRTVRYYVQEGLVDPPAGRGRGGYYSDLHAAQLARIRALQEQGYRLDAIRGMLALRGAAEAPRPAEAAPATGGEPSPAPEPGAELPQSPHPEHASQVSTRSSWTRHIVAPGVELHVSADAASQCGPAIATALEALRSIIQREGGLHG